MSNKKTLRRFALRGAENETIGCKVGGRSGSPSDKLVRSGQRLNAYGEGIVL